MVPLVGVGLGIFLFDEFLFGSVGTSSFGGPPVNGDGLSLGYFFDMSVELVGEDTHHAVAQPGKPQGPE